MDIQTSLTTAGISTGIFILYKIINNYRLRSDCNNQTLEITLEDTRAVAIPIVSINVHEEHKDNSEKKSSDYK